MVLHAPDYELIRLNSRGRMVGLIVFQGIERCGCCSGFGNQTAFWKWWFRGFAIQNIYRTRIGRTGWSVFEGFYRESSQLPRFFSQYGRWARVLLQPFYGKPRRFPRKPRSRQWRSLHWGNRVSVRSDCWPGFWGVPAYAPEAYWSGGALLHGYRSVSLGTHAREIPDNRQCPLYTGWCPAYFCLDTDASTDATLSFEKVNGWIV